MPTDAEITFADHAGRRAEVDPQPPPARPLRRSARRAQATGFGRLRPAGIPLAVTVSHQARSLSASSQRPLLAASLYCASSASTHDALADRAQDQHGEVDQAADDHDHVNRPVTTLRPSVPDAADPNELHAVLPLL